MIPLHAVLQADVLTDINSEPELQRNKPCDAERGAPNFWRCDNMTAPF